MELHIVLDGRKELSGQLYRQLRDAMRGGRIGAGERLPPSRLLSDQLGLARKTVAEAYSRLTLGEEENTHGRDSDMKGVPALRQAISRFAGADRLAGILAKVEREA